MLAVKLDPARLLGFRLVDDGRVADEKVAGVVIGAKLGNKPGQKTRTGLGMKFGQKGGIKSVTGFASEDDLSAATRLNRPATDRD